MNSRLPNEYLRLLKNVIHILRVLFFSCEFFAKFLKRVRREP